MISGGGGSTAGRVWPQDIAKNCVQADTPAMAPTWVPGGNGESVLAVRSPLIWSLIDDVLAPKVVAVAVYGDPRHNGGESWDAGSAAATNGVSTYPLASL